MSRYSSTFDNEVSVEVSEMIEIALEHYVPPFHLYSTVSLKKCVKALLNCAYPVHPHL